MRKLLIVLASCVVLSGCASTTGSDSTISQIQSATRLACSFLPTAETIARILSNSTFIDTSASIAQAICAAVTTVPLAEGPGDRKPRVKGVVIKGRFVR